METAKPAEKPRWATEVGAQVTEPPDAKKDIGWVAEMPPFQFFNWLNKWTYDWINYFEAKGDADLGGQAETTLTISAGAVTPTGGSHRIDTEAAAASDDLTNLATTNLADGRVLLLRSVDAGRVVTLKHAAGGTGQIALRGAADLVLDAPTKWVLLMRSGADWVEVLSSFVGADPAPYLGADLDVRTRRITTSETNGDIVIEPNGTGALAPATNGKALGKAGARWAAFLSSLDLADDFAPDADGTRSLGLTATRWGSIWGDQISATDWVRTAALDSESAGGTLAIGGTNADVVAIGRPGGTVAFYGSLTEIHTTNTFVQDKLITINDGGIAGSGDGAGLEVEENALITAYIKVSANRNKWSFKAPNDAAVISIGAEATAVGDIGLVSNVFTFMSSGFAFKNSTGTQIAAATDAGALTFGPASSDAINHVIRGSIALDTGVAMNSASSRWIGSSGGGVLNNYDTGNLTYLVAGGYNNGSNWLAKSANQSLSIFQTNAPTDDSSVIFTFRKQTDSSASDYTHAAGATLATGTVLGQCTAAGAWTFGAPASGVNVVHTLKNGSADANSDVTLRLTTGNGNWDFRAYRTAGKLEITSANAIVVGEISNAGYWALGPSSPSFAVKKLTANYTSGQASFAHGLAARARVKFAIGKLNDAVSDLVVPYHVSDSLYVRVTVNDTFVTFSGTGVSDRTAEVYVFYEAS